MFGWSLRCSQTSSWRGCGGSRRSAGRSCSGSFTLAPADVAFVDPGRGRGAADRLGLAVAVCSLSWLGFVPDEVASAPQAAVVRLAEQLRVDPAVIGSYGRRAKTATEHLRLAAQYLGWRPPTGRWRSRSSTSSCWRGRWSMIRRRCCSGWRASS
ncbi:DUF4158 domain-containing protein [Pseudonocardia sp. ICBG1293]|uniref:DUF4158 domain-containing protein n=1 Tax=Pseudonocardia sp. ICBG1293 TaxID=2844382 RepID=UPI0021032FD6|nr:DUF4158 domain-containing protein [Pseudonocardia sp. ICBG1293]